MTRSLWSGALVVVACAAVASAATLTVEIAATSSTTVAPGGTVSYEITGVVSSGDNLGLAIFGVDLETDTGVAQSQASAGAGMGSFVKPDGITNPAGYGGTVDADDLLQIGGGQNTIGNDGVSPHPSYPVGTVVQGVGQSGAVVLAQGSVTAPAAPGTYNVNLANVFGSVLLADTGTFYTVEAATASLGASGSFQVTVGVSLPALVSSDPDPAAVEDGTFCKQMSNCLTLTFDSAVDPTGAPSIVPTAGGGDLSGSFTVSFNGAEVTAVESNVAGVLSHQTWYTITEGSLNVDPFSLDICVVVGDTDGDGTVGAFDLGVAWAQRPPAPQGACVRGDTDGDGTVGAFDLGVAWANNGDSPPAKP